MYFFETSCLATNSFTVSPVVGNSATKLNHSHSFGNRMGPDCPVRSTHQDARDITVTEERRIKDDLPTALVLSTVSPSAELLPIPLDQLSTATPSFFRVCNNQGDAFFKHRKQLAPPSSGF